MKKWKVAVAGAGRAGEDLAVAGFKMGGRFTDLSNAEVVALADVDEAKAREVAAKFGVPGVFSGIEKMLDVAKPDVLIITTPIREHYRNAMACIDRGIPFVLEKPATETVGQLEEIRAAADRRGVKGMVSHNYRFLDGFRTAWDWYQKGELGEILHVDRVWMTPPQEDRMERVDGWWHRIPGGRMADGLPHHLYIPYPFVGEMALRHVSVKKLSKDRPWSQCDEAHVSLETRSGYVNIRMSTNQELWPYGKSGATYYAIVYGTKRNAFLFQNEAFLLAPGLEGQVKATWDRLVSTAGHKLAAVLGKRPEQGYRGGHNVMYNRFLAYLEGRTGNPVPWEEAVHVMRMTDEVARAMEGALRRESAAVLAEELVSD